MLFYYYLLLTRYVQGSILLFIINYMLLNMDGPIADHVSCDQSYMGIMGPEYLRQTMLYSIIIIPILKALPLWRYSNYHNV